MRLPLTGLALLLLPLVSNACTPYDNTTAASIAEESSSRPRILLLGDSISMGYTSHVRKLLTGEAEVVRPMRNETAAENCAGTIKQHR